MDCLSAVKKTKNSILLATGASLTLALTLGMQTQGWAAAECELSRAEQTEASGDLKKALGLYEDCIDQPASRERAIDRYTQILIAQNQKDAAIAALNKFIKLSPFSFDAHSKLVDLYRIKGDTAKALKELEILEKLRAGDMSVRQRRGFTHFDAGQYKEAIVDLNLVLEDSPNNYLARMIRAKSYLALKDADHAMEDLKTLRAADSAAAEPVLLLAQIRFDAKNFKESQEILAPLLKRSDAPAAAYELMGDIKAQAGLLREAKDLYAEAVKRNPKYIPVGLKLGKAHAELGESARAEEEFLRELSIDADSDSSQYNLVRVYQERGKVDRVGQLLKAWFQKHPERAWSAFAYAKSLAQVGQLDQAETVIRTHEKIAGTTVESMLALASVKEKSGNTRETLKLFAQAQEKFPAKNEVRLAWGQYYKQIGAYPKALAKLAEIPQTDENHFKQAQEVVAQVHSLAKDEKKK